MPNKVMLFSSSMCLPMKAMHCRAFRSDCPIMCGNGFDKHENKHAFYLGGSYTGQDVVGCSPPERATYFPYMLDVFVYITPPYRTVWVIHSSAFGWCVNRRRRTHQQRRRRQQTWRPLNLQIALTKCPLRAFVAPDGRTRTSNTPAS